MALGEPAAVPGRLLRRPGQEPVGEAVAGRGAQLQLDAGEAGEGQCEGGGGVVALPHVQDAQPLQPAEPAEGVVRSVSAWVGCSSALIALMTDIRRWAAQARISAGSSAVRATSTSSIRDMTRPVSSLVSPVLSWRSPSPYETICAPSRRAPAEKAVRVRVEVRRK